jgi:ABC-type ATPase with predicted acetyltransferase domain
MSNYSISKQFPWRGIITDKVAQVCRMFGLTVDKLKANAVTHDCRIEINDGDIVYITGPSGAGKSTILSELEKSVPQAESVNLAQIELPIDRTLIDCIDGDLLNGLRTLSTVGLNDVFCILNQPANLSTGQKYRFHLAIALASKKRFIFADEFCSDLDRVTAAVISYNIHKFAKRTGVTFILASCHEDILMDLAPDVIVVKELSGPTQVIYKQSSP